MAEKIPRLNIIPSRKHISSVVLTREQNTFKTKLIDWRYEWLNGMRSTATMNWVSMYLSFPTKYQAIWIKSKNNNITRICGKNLAKPHRMSITSGLFSQVQSRWNVFYSKISYREDHMTVLLLLLSTVLFKYRFFWWISNNYGNGNRVALNFINKNWQHQLSVHVTTVRHRYQSNQNK